MNSEHDVPLGGAFSRSVLAAFIVLAPLSMLGQVAPSTRVAGSLPVAQAVDANTDLFLPAVAYDSGGPRSSSVAVVDLNGDGKPDLVVVNNNPEQGVDSTVGVMLGRGDGTFKPVVLYDLGLGGANTVAVGDLNHDGKPDLIVASSGNVSVLLGNGDGSVKAAVVYGSDGRLYSDGSVPPLIADLNGDGKQDVIVVNQTDQNNQNGSAAVFLGNGDGTLQAVKVYDSGGFLVSSIALADLNADGIQDIVVLNCSLAGSTACPGDVATVGILLGKGDGTFRAVTSYPRAGLGADSSPVVVADVNRDGIPDLLVGNSCKFVKSHCASDALVSVFIGKGDGAFRSAVNYDSGGGNVFSIAVADVYGDQKLDLVVSDRDAVVLRGNGDGTFLFPDTYGNLGYTSGVVVKDLNGDGKPDLISVGVTSVSFVSVLLGNGSGFSAPLFFQTAGFGIVLPAIEDVNSDARPDLIAVNFCNDSFCRGPDGSLGVLLNNPGVVFNSTTTTVTSDIDPAPLNQPVTYTVRVTSATGNPLPGQVVCFAHPKNYLSPFFSGTLVNNQAIFSIQYKTLGTHRVQCEYMGDSVNSGSISLNLSEYIRQLPVGSKTILTTSGSPSHVGESVTFTASVTSNFGKIPDGELIAFYDGAKALGSAPVSGGTAAFTTSSLSAKKHTMKAVYAGDSTFQMSHGTVIQIVEP
ncbi:MAG: VCBS repeat-containing protein [Acidobacteria bacterium]|nr:VCBS repeat-containing protein [Acidobacteriota bacterium]